MKFTSVRALLWLADEEAGERIGVDAVRSIGPLLMIRREVNSPAPTARLRSRLGWSHGSTEVEGNTVNFCGAF